ncbi:MAG TPA: MFS transporter [Thermoplasmata archaeon]|nr:MFS transporter [Thermoplasmata archaeon]
MTASGRPGPGSRGPFRRVAFALAVTAFGAGAPTPVYALYESRFGFGSGVLGLVFGAYTLGVVATMLLVAPTSDRVGRRPVLFLGMVLSALSGLLFAFAGGVLALAAARIVSGLCVGATTSTATAAMASLIPDGDQHHVARVAVAANFGGVASGVAVSGLLVAYAPDPTRLIFVLLIALSALGAVAIATVPETVHAPSPRGIFHARRPRVPAALARSFGIAAIGLATCYAIYGFFAALAPTFLRTELGVGGPATIGLVVATMFALAALAQLALAEVRDRRALLLGFPLLLVALALFAAALLVASLPLLLAAAALLGTGVGCAYMGSVTLIDRVSPEAGRGEILSMFYLVGYLALAVPTVGVAFASEAVGLGAAEAAFGAVLGAFVAFAYATTIATPTPPGGEGRPRAPRAVEGR